MSARVSVIIPALNEQDAIGDVVSGMLANGADEAIVVDNGSTDSTADNGRAAGARVVVEKHRGYGRACLAGIGALRDAEIVVFADGDGCDDPTDLPAILAPIVRGEADLSLGSRMSGESEKGAIPFHSRFGNRLASTCMRLLFGQKVTDLGPFRAIRFEALMSLRMTDPNFGWTVEMQAKAALASLRVAETPVRYRCRRTGKSKITGNLTKSVEAGVVILGTIVKIRVHGRKLLSIN